MAKNNVSIKYLLSGVLTVLTTAVMFAAAAAEVHASASAGVTGAKLAAAATGDPFRYGMVICLICMAAAAVVIVLMLTRKKDRKSDGK